MDYIRQCVRLAPSAVNRQPWRFILVDDSQPQLLQRVRDSYHRDWIQSVHTIVIALENREECWTRRYDSKNHADIDIAIAVEHLCLAATEQGLASCWVCNFDINQLCESVSFPQGYTPAALIPLGYPADQAPEKVRKPMEEVWQ